jgi:hypothetical protein
MTLEALLLKIETILRNSTATEAIAAQAALLAAIDGQSPDEVALFRSEVLRPTSATPDSNCTSLDHFEHSGAS